MFRIRKVFDETSKSNAFAVAQVKEIIKEHFSELDESRIEEISMYLKNPLKYKFKSILFVSDNVNGKVRGFAFLLYAPDLNFCFLDYIATEKKEVTQGVGGAIYRAVRREALQLGALGIFFECLPDDPELCKNEKILLQNISRLKFYERFGARPIINTKYETPLKEGGDNPPYLVYDGLGKDIPLERDVLKKIIRAILTRKYSYLCPEAYIDMVVESVRDNPIKIRDYKYVKKTENIYEGDRYLNSKIKVIVNDKHLIHHVKEKGYVESPVRVASILKELEKTEIFERVKSESFSETHIAAVHNKEYIKYFKKVTENMSEKTAIYPYVFPVRNRSKPPKELDVRAGYYCIDTFTPLSKNAFIAAKEAVNCALTGASLIVGGESLVYALVRPPGHHAESEYFGGFCYFNSNAIAANYLSGYGKVAILDIDYHHGNGQQEIFYKRDDVLTVSIHGDPSFAYPYFSGYSSEKGEGKGLGYNINFPLKEKLTPEEYKVTLRKAIKKLKDFEPKFLVVALGLDTAKKDPTGTWELTSNDFRDVGKLIGEINSPILVVQEGGYDTRVLGKNACYFFIGLAEDKYRGKVSFIVKS